MGLATMCTANKHARRTTPRPEIIEGVFREAQIVTVSGGFGAGKSPLLANWAFCIATGLAWCGRRVVQRPVMIMAHETPDWSFWRGWELMGERYNIAPPTDLTCEAMLEAGSEETASTAELLDALTKPLPQRVAWLEEKIAARPDMVLIIDPFSMFFSIELKAQQIMMIYKWARMLHRKHPAVTFVFSFNTRKKHRLSQHRPSLIKDPRDWLEEASGGMEIQSRADARVGLEYRGHSADGIHEFNGWRRGEPMEPMFLTPFVLGEDGEGNSRLAGFEPTAVTDEDTLDLLSPKMKEVYDDIAPGDVYTMADLIAKMPRSTAYSFKRQAVRLGLLVPVDGGWKRREGA